MASMDQSISAADMSGVKIMRSSAAERNKGAILEQLRQVLGQEPVFALELASGTGQHVAYFAENLSHVTWQPSEIDDKSLKSIAGYVQVSKRPNIRDPVIIDVTQSPETWANGTIAPASCDLMVAVNMIHISEWGATEGLFKGCGYYLKPNGLLLTYGPYKEHGEISPNSNVQFDQMLKQQNSEWGLRDIDDLEKLAHENMMDFEKVVDMPANNKTLVFRKKSS